MILGVGKSAVIEAITLHAEKILRSTGDHPNHPRVLVCAPTGKAASIISKYIMRMKNEINCFTIFSTFSDGITLHSAFNFKFGNDHQPLGDKALASFRENFQNLKVLIVDEVSLLGSDMLYKIHLRLNEILGGKKTFGGIAVILVGDLLQLAPVKANYIFNVPRNPHFAAYHDANPLWKSFDSMILKWNHRQGKIINCKFEMIHIS